MAAKIVKKEKTLTINKDKSDQRKVTYTQFTFQAETPDDEVLAGFKGLCDRNKIGDLVLWDAVNRIVETTVRNRIYAEQTADQSDLAKLKRLAKGEHADAVDAELKAILAKYKV